MKKSLFLYCLFSLSLFTHTGAVAADNIKALTIRDAQPFDFSDEYGNMMGFDVDLITAIAEEQGLNISIDAANFAEISTQVQNGDADLFLLPLSITAEREKIMDFSNSYITIPTAMAYTQEALDIKTLSDLKGKKVVVLDGFPFLEHIKAQSPASIYKAATNFLMYRAIWNGKAEVAVGDQQFFRHMLKNRPESEFTIVQLPSLTTSDDGYWGIKKDSALRKKINQGLRRLKENGEYQKIYQKWFGH